MSREERRHGFRDDHPEGCDTEPAPQAEEDPPRRRSHRLRHGRAGVRQRGVREFDRQHEGFLHAEPHGRSRRGRERQTRPSACSATRSRSSPTTRSRRPSRCTPRSTRRSPPSRGFRSGRPWSRARASADRGCQGESRLLRDRPPKLRGGVRRHRVQRSASRPRQPVRDPELPGRGRRSTQPPPPCAGRPGHGHPGSGGVSAYGRSPIRAASSTPRLRRPERVALVDVVTARALNGYGLGYVGAGSEAPGAVREPLAAELTRGRRRLDRRSLRFDLGCRCPGSRRPDSGVAWNRFWPRAAGPGDSLVLGGDRRVELHPRQAAPRSRSGGGPRIARGHVRRAGLGPQVMDWQEAAGMAAQGLVALQLVFGAGMVVIGAGAFVVLMNGIVIAVLERRGEIGTMRALGATKQFIRRLFAAETLSLVTVSSCAGLALGMMVSLIVSRRGIALSNSALVSLFGGKVLRPRLGALSVFAHFTGAVAAGSLAWVYPVRLALRISPSPRCRGSSACSRVLGAQPLPAAAAVRPHPLRDQPGVRPRGAHVECFEVLQDALKDKASLYFAEHVSVVGYQGCRRHIGVPKGSSPPSAPPASPRGESPVVRLLPHRRGALLRGRIGQAAADDRRRLRRRGRRVRPSQYASGGWEEMGAEAASSSASPPPARRELASATT